MARPVARCLSSLILLLSIGSCSEQATPQQTESDLLKSLLKCWDLPPALLEIQSELELLQLPSHVDDVSWVSDDLEVLLLPQSDLVEPKSLPQGLRVLDLTGAAKLESLPELPQSLTALSVTRSQALDLDKLRGPLRVLSTDQEIFREDGAAHPALAGLEGLVLLGLPAGDPRKGDLRKLGSLKSLVLSGPTFDEKQSLPQVRSLVLDSTGHREISGLPEGLRHLGLRDLWRLAGVRDLVLPPDLESLEVQYNTPRPIGLASPLPRALSSVSVPAGHLVGLPQDLGASLTELHLLPNTVYQAAEQQSQAGSGSGSSGGMQSAPRPELSHLKLLAARLDSLDSVLGERSDWAKIPGLRLALSIVSMDEVVGLEPLIEELIACGKDLEGQDLDLSPFINLRVLDLGCEDRGRIRLTAIPESLEVLSVAGQDIERLSDLGGVEVLDIRETNLILEGLKTDRLTTLVATASKHLDLKALPKLPSRLFLVGAGEDKPDLLWNDFRRLAKTQPYSTYRYPESHF